MNVFGDGARFDEDALFSLLTDPVAVIAQIDVRIGHATPEKAVELQSQRSELRDIFPASVKTEGLDG